MVCVHWAYLLQYELLDALYVVLRQMPRFRRAGGDGGATGREFDNMAEYLHYRWCLVVRIFVFASLCACSLCAG